MAEQNKFYITTAIAYASRKPHIGNTYEVIMTDAIARYKRQKGFDVYFLTGTDEHGQKIEDLAKEKNISPKQYVDEVAGSIKSIWNLMNTTYDHFIRTTDESHERVVQHIFRKFYESGDIYKSEYEGWYCVPCESFFTDTQAGEGVCPDCGRPLKKTKEEAYFFRMSAYTDRLMKYIDEHPDFIEPESRRKEMVNNFIKPGLQDLCVSRTSFKWGIPVDFDDKHVIYVWVDALSNYITALGYDVDEKGELYNKYWPADVHIIGKDILRFHTIYWPIFLMALGEPLPKKVFGHPWMLFGSDKMSKSKGNVMYADELASIFGVDGVRHYVLAEMPYAQDGSITYEQMVKRYNADLANNLGNLVNRTLAMTKKYFDGTVPAPEKTTELEESFAEFARDCIKRRDEAMDTYHIADAVEAVFDLFRRANKYIDETAPWALAKSDEGMPYLKTVMYNLLEAIRLGAVLLLPFMPQTSEDILRQLGTEEDSLEFGKLQSGRATGEAHVLFSRMDEAEVLSKAESLRASEKAQGGSSESEKPAEKPESLPATDIDHFMGIELRVAKVTACEPVPKAKKLLKLTLDLGYEQRTVVSGIAKFYTPDDLIGRKVIVVANLKPAVLCGVESNGMILASCGSDEKVRVIFADNDAELGSRVR